MKCPKCQVENPDGIRFCGQCGTRLERICPQCTFPNPPDFKFCGGCGQSLSEPSTALPEPTPSPGSERKHITVLFSDLSGYTAMSEKLDPEEVKEITTRIFGEAAKIVDRYEGFVEKYIGDAVVALFGVPKAHEDDHLRAIRAAREIHEIVTTVGLQHERKIGRRLTFHSGIATGLVVTGEINLEKGTHGVAGDTINLASRLSGIAKPGEIIVGENTYLQSTGAFSFDKLEPVSLKGKAEPVIPYKLVEEKAEATRGLATQGISSPLVGRNAEIAAIKASVNRLLDGQGGILSVIGEAGLGKSRLMAEIHRHYAHENLFWLEGRTLSYGQKISYWPFKEILRQYAGITEDDSDTEAWEKFEAKITGVFGETANEILPYLASLLGLEVKGELGKNLEHLDGDSMGKQVYLSSRRFFERLAGNRPLVLVFEDLHWADESTILLIEHLFALIDRVPLLICGVSRPEVNVPAVRLRESALKDHERRYTEIRLNPLSPTECTDLMNNLLSIEDLPSRVRQVILQKADGNPFFLEEPAYMEEVSDLAHRRGIKVHTDGARIFNAAIALGFPCREFARHTDTISFCLSKGLSAPAGSMLCGPKEYIAEARRQRKMVGGGMRQAGIIAAAGIVALETMIDRLSDDHENAKKLARGISEIPGILLDLDRVITNIVFFDLKPGVLTASQLAERTQARGVLVGVIGERRVRVVTHYGIDREDVEITIGAIRSAVRE